MCTLLCVNVCELYKLNLLHFHYKNLKGLSLSSKFVFNLHDVHELRNVFYKKETEP